MKKGITPIIAIVILLLIVVAIAGMAYTFILGFYGSFTGQVLEITSSTCYSNGSVMLFIKNNGQEAIDSADINVAREVVAGTAGAAPYVKLPATLDPGGSGMIYNACTTPAGGTATCRYVVTSAGRSQTVVMQCY